MKRIIYLLISVIYCLGAVAQTPAVKADSAQAKLEPVGGPGTALGLNLGTNGVGIQLAQNIGMKRMLAVRVGATYFPFTISNLEYDMNGTKVILNGDLKLGAISAMFDFHPFQNAFKLTAGMGYMMTGVNTTGLLKDSTQQGDIMLSPKEVGEIKLDINVPKLCPYVGIGFGRAVPKTRFSFNFEVGAYYMGHPELTFKTTGMLEPTSSQEVIMQDNVSGISWLPQMNFSFNFKLGK